MNDATLGLLAVGTKLPLAGFVLDLGGDELLDAAGCAVELRPQAFQVLRHLALNAGRLVTKEELLAAVWPGLIVTDDSLVQAIGDIRRALGDSEHRVLKTVPRRGYTLVADAVAAPARLQPALAEPIPAAVPADLPPATAAAALPAAQPSRGGRRPMATAALLGLAAAAIVIAAALWLARSPGDDARAPTAAGAAPAAASQKMPDRPSVAVLAFRSPDAEAAGQMLARGVAEDLIAELARNRDLRVVAYHSSFSFAGKDVPLAKIGERLGSRYLVDGTVRRDGELLRVGIEMIDSRDGQVVWASQHTADSVNVLTTRDALVRRIAGTVHSKLRQTEERAALARAPKSLDVYSMTLRAIALKHRFNPEATREARALLQQAIAIDPGYAPAHLYLGMVNAIDSLQRLTGEWHPGRVPEMLVPIRRAIELDPNLPAAHFAEALALSEARDFEGALASMQRCVELGPNDADCWMFLGRVQLSLGQIDAAVRSGDQALDLNPLPPAYLRAQRAGALWAARRYDEAIREADDCLSKAPRHATCRRHRLAALAESGRLDAAREEATTLRAQVPAVTTAMFNNFFADSAVALRERAVAAALAAGIPAAAAPETQAGIAAK